MGYGFGAKDCGSELLFFFLLLVVLFKPYGEVFGDELLFFFLLLVVLFMPYCSGSFVFGASNNA